MAAAHSLTCFDQLRCCQQEASQYNKTPTRLPYTFFINDILSLNLEIQEFQSINIHYIKKMDCIFMLSSLRQPIGATTPYSQIDSLSSVHHVKLLPHLCQPVDAQCR